MGVGMNNLARLGLFKTQLACHQVDSARLGKLCFRKSQLAVLFA